MAPNYRPLFQDYDCDQIWIPSIPIPSSLLGTLSTGIQTEKVQLRNIRLQASILQDAEAQTTLLTDIDLQPMQESEEGQKARGTFFFYQYCDTDIIWSWCLNGRYANIYE